MTPHTKHLIRIKVFLNDRLTATHSFQLASIRIHGEGGADLVLPPQGRDRIEGHIACTEGQWTYIPEQAGSGNSAILVNEQPTSPGRQFQLRTGSVISSGDIRLLVVELLNPPRRLPRLKLNLLAGR